MARHGIAALHEVGVEETVAVVVEPGRAAAHGLGDPVAELIAAHVHEVDPRGRGDLFEPRGGVSALRVARGARVVRAAARGKNRGETDDGAEEEVRER